MSISQNYGNTNPSLLLNFAAVKKLDPRITYARASEARYYDGKTVAKAEENLFLYSQDFDSAAWPKTSATVTANSTTAPDGTATADTVIVGRSIRATLCRILIHPDYYSADYTLSTNTLNSP
jgi:hypothetical protein